MKLLLRWVVRAALGLLALLAIFFAVLVAANWRDEPLTPEAARLLAPPVPPAPDTPNAYNVLLGLTAPDGEDDAAVGRRLRDQLDRQFLQNPAHPQYSQLPTNQAFCSSDPGASCDWSKLRCPLQKGADCVAFYLGEQSHMQQVIAQQSVLRQRYRQFAQIPVFDEPPLLTADEPLPAYPFLTQAAEMRLAEAVFTLNRGDLPTGADMLMQEIRLHRRLLASSSQLITQMIAVGMLCRDYAVLSNAIEHWPQLAGQATLAEAWLPLCAPEYDLSRVVESEAAPWAKLIYSDIQEQRNHRFRLNDLAQGVQAMKEDQQLFGMPWYATLLASNFVLPNATINARARQMNEDIRDIQGDAPTLEARYQARMAAGRMVPWATWRFIRNPGEKACCICLISIFL